MSASNVRVKVVLAEVGVRMAFGDWIGVLVGWIWVEVVSIVLGLRDMLVGVSTGGVDCGRVEVEIGLVDMVDGESDGVLVNRLFSMRQWFTIHKTRFHVFNPDVARLL
jgi:hypothetical protein